MVRDPGESVDDIAHVRGEGRGEGITFAATVENAFAATIEREF